MAFLGSLATVTALTAVSTGSLADGDVYLITDDKRGGLFRWNSSDLSTEVGYDDGTNAGVYFPPDSDTDGSSGAWLRQAYFDGEPLQVEWFGAHGNGTTNDATAFQDTIDFCAAQVSGGAYTSVGFAIQLRQSAEYKITTQVSIPTSLDGLGIYGHPGQKGPFITTDESSIVLFMVGADLSGGGDTVDSNATYGFEIRDVLFENTNATSTACVALQMNRTPWAKILECHFRNFNKAIHGHRFNGDTIRGCRFMSRRTSADSAAAFIHFEGVYASPVPGGPNNTNTPGGGIRISDCEFVGNSDDVLGQTAGVKISAADTIYFDNCHFVHCLYHVHVAPEDNNYNHRIIDLMFTGCYFDVQDTSFGSVGVLFQGTIDNNASPLMENFTFNGCYFRDQIIGVKVDVTDGGSYVSSGGELKNFRFDGCYFRKYDAQALVFKGENNSRIPAKDVIISGCFFGDGNTGGGATSAMSANIQNIIISNNVFAAEGSTPTRAIDIVLKETSTRNQSVIIEGNDFSRLAYSGVLPWRISNGLGKSVSISGNVLNNVSEYDGQVYTAATENDAAAVIWSKDFAADNEILHLEAIVTGVSHAPSSADKYVSAKVSATVHRNDSTSAISFISGEGVPVDLAENVTNNSAPVMLIALFGAATRSNSTAYSLGDTILVSGSVWACIEAGASGSSAPTFTGNSVVDGTVRWVKVADEDSNRIALVVSGGGTADLRWAAHVNALATS